MDAPNPPRRRLRLWHLIVGSLLAVVILLVATAFALRASGAADLTRTIADLTARGYPMTVEALRAGAVDGDPMVQEAYERWRVSRTGKKIDFSEVAFGPKWFGWIDSGEPVSQNLLDLIAAHAAEFVDLRTAIRTGRLKVGSSTLLRKMVQDEVFYFPDLLNLREAAFFLRASALAGDQQAFADLLGLVDALSPVRGGIDSTIESTLTEEMNRTAVELEMFGRLTGTAGDDWLGRRPRMRLQYAEALRWDCGAWKFWADRADRSPASSAGASVWSSTVEMADSVPLAIREWIFCDADMAANYCIQADLSDWLLGSGRPPTRSMRTWRSITGGYFAKVPVVMLNSAMTSEAEHRSRHVAVLIRRESIRRGSLPSDNVAVFADKACGSWMEGGESAYWLAYERLSPTRFRISVDTKRPVPTILAALPNAPEWFDVAKPGVIAQSEFGKPAGKALRLSLRGANTEIVVPDFPPKQVPSVPGLITPAPPAPEKR